MARVTIEDCLEKVDSRFSLVHLAVRRVLQLRSGAPPLIDAPKNKEIVVALREIAAAKVTVDNIRQLDEQKALPERLTKVQDETAAREELKEIMEKAVQFGGNIDLDTVDEELSGDEEEA
ncbi:DNA-directed RNA polymerase subunit omega [Desulfoferrobacter suflitae]|uniref:DNA-directed RNA polymerase subunit omega n=1 Tax=Desulfoferrobacter suflitae TaxID=2865782 RepID=UPI00216405C1|nr:DNA-directed RNA polymerase subunit omega [Desulfoferrobacter suflitae]MCK8600312.1 DNA-directed RNA polymerase subunit omega [Desulfoferrobacter suflitae]